MREYGLSQTAQIYYLAMKSPTTCLNPGQLE